MKFTLCCAAAFLIFFAGVQYGLREGTKREKERTEMYRNLYNQAIMWQVVIPHKARNIELKEKEE